LFKPGRDVHRIAHQCVIDAPRRPDISDERISRFNTDTDAGRDAICEPAG